MRTSPRPAILLLILALASLLPAQMAGSYTIHGGRPTAGRNFATLREAVDALALQGLSGPVVFEVFDDGGPFTESHPFTTRNVSWGTSDAVLVLEEFPGASADRRVVFRPAPGERPVLDASGRAMGVFWNGADFVTLEGFEIHGAVFDAISLYSEAMHGTVHGAEIRGNRLHSCGGSGVVVYGNLPAPEDTLVVNNVFHDLCRSGGGGFENTARYGYLCTRRSVNTRVLHNTFHATSGVGQWFAVVGTIPGSLTDEPIAEFRGNLVTKPARADRPLFLFPTISGVPSIPSDMDSNWYGSTSTGNFALVGPSGAVPVTSLANWQTSETKDLASLSGPAPFADAPNGDYRPAGGSAFAAGVLVGSSPLRHDARGERRPGQPAFGALEGVDRASAAGTRRVGTGGLNSMGTLATLDAPSDPALGNLAFTVELEGGVPNAASWLFASFGVDPRPLRLADGAALLLEPNGLILLYNSGLSPLGAFGTDGQGRASFPLPIVNHPNLAGADLVVQALVLDAFRPSGHQLSDALELRLR